MELLKQKSIAILDDEQGIRSSLQLLLEPYFDQTQVFETPEDLKVRLPKQLPDLILMDMNFTKGSIDGKEGLNLLFDIRQKYPDLPIVVMTAYSDVRLAVESMKTGAADFVNKPWSNERLLVTLLNVLRLQESNQKLNQWKVSEPWNKASDFELDLGMIGRSEQMDEVRKKIRKVAGSDASVMILGENGTGKELAAKAIHQLSERNQNPFVKIDLGSVHEDLFESELFGAKKGSYTGISRDKPGRMGLAHQGTLFLDEVGNLPLSLQSKLLSVLQNRELVPLGGTQAQKIDIRLVSATNMDPVKLSNNDYFRQDLRYRMNTVEVELPALRNRREDIPVLLDHFLQIFAGKYKKEKLQIAQELYERSMHYSWPGNVRELEHAVERAVLMCEGQTIQESDLLPHSLGVTQVRPATFNLAQTEKELIQSALEKHMGSITKAAKDLGITRAALYRRLDKYNI